MGGMGKQWKFKLKLNNFIQMLINTLRAGGFEVGVGGKMETLNFFLGLRIK